MMGRLGVGAPILCLLALLFIVGFGAMAADWDGPSEGPVAQPDKTILFISQNAQNSGISDVYRSFEAASKLLGWHIAHLDARGDPSLLASQMATAVARHPDGIVLAGVEPRDMADGVAEAHQAGIVLVGWHAAKQPGANADLFTNISTDPLEVAKMAARYVIDGSVSHPGVVILTDDSFGVAQVKARRMEQLIEGCPTCRMLGVINIPIASIDDHYGDLMRSLSERFGDQWTHVLAINDIYFDNINYVLTRMDRKPIIMISAGDGSQRALGRIKAGLSQQQASVAEPLKIQGWQLADELNRALAGTKPSGYVTRPVLVTVDSLRELPDLDFESQTGFRAAYLRIWRGHPSASTDFQPTN